MATSIKRACAAVLAAGLLAGLMSAVPATADELPQDGVPGQSEVDGATLGNPTDQIGGWAAMTGGVEARPFIKRLSVVRSGVETVVINNTAGEANPVADPSSNLGAVISPYNLCAPGRTDNCYSRPNRVALSVGYMRNGQLHTNFDSPDDTAGIDESTVFDVTLGLNTLGQSLRWSWLTGRPSFWRIDNIGARNAELRVRFTPLQVPVHINGGGCTQIPVQATCPVGNATGLFRTASLLLSLDTTLSSAFTGALFATDRAYIGSLDVAPGPAPVITYGIAAPITVAGSANQARLWAFLSDASLLNSFQVPPGSGEPRGIFSLALSSGALGADPWDQWTASANGTPGWLITSPPITVPAVTGAAPPAIAPTGIRREAASSRAILMRMKQKAALAGVGLSRSSGRLKVAVSTALVRSGTYRVVLSKVISVPLGRTRSVTSWSWSQTSGKVGRTATLSATASKTVPKGTRLAVLVQRKTSATTWAFVASAVRVAP